MVTELYNDGSHICLMFSDLVDDDGSGAVQANQFLVVDGGHGALIDPGGNMTYHALFVGMSRYFNPKSLEIILASHADPDIVASLNKWFVATEAKIHISKIWARFVPHFCGVGSAAGRIVAIPDEGERIPVGQAELYALPAHFLHSEGNFQFYDPTSRILFSGDLGASMVPPEQANRPVTDFDAHIHLMDGFHRRYMVSNRVCRLWAEMVRGLDVRAIVPQHGKPMVGRTMVGRFIHWVENLECGVDLMSQRHYAVPG